MSTIAFNCSKCNKFTRHVQIGFLEYEKLMGRPRWCGTGFWFLFSQEIERVMGNRFYKCEVCGSVHKRNSKNEVVEEKLCK